MSYRSPYDPYDRTATDQRRRDFYRSSRLDDLLFGDHSASQQRKQIIPAPYVRAPGAQTRSNVEQAQTSNNAGRNSRLVQTHQADAIWTPNMSKSVAINMKLGITEDIDQELEELSRLRRHGDLRDTRKFLKQKLSGRSDDPYFVVLYAQLLSEMGDFRSLDTLMPTGLFEDVKDETMQKNNDLLRQIWDLLIIRAMLPRGEFTELTTNEIDKALALLETSTELGSTENLAMNSNDWAMVYHALASEGRVWEFRDIFMAFKQAFGQDRAFDAFFNTESVKEITQTISSDWETVDYDESTNLALLDIASFLILESDFEKTSLQYFQTCLEHGEKLVESLMGENPAAMKSRPFARWLVAKAAVLSCHAHGNPFSSFGFLNAYPGMQLRQGDGVHVPIYVPLQAERPTWKVPPASREWEDAVQMALAIAKDLGDYETQVLCLKHLIVRSQEPHQLLEELSELQNSIQNDQDGYLRTCLSKLLVLEDGDPQRGLAEELFRFGQDKTILNQKLPIEYHNLSLQWARSIILPTLPATVGGTITIDKSGPFYARLPTYIRQFIDARETFHSQPKPIAPFPKRKAKPTQWSIETIVGEDIERSARLVPVSEAINKPGISRVRTLPDDAGNSRLVMPAASQSRHGLDTRREIDRQNEKISRRTVSRSIPRKPPPRIYNETVWSELRRERPIRRDSYRDGAVQTPAIEPVRREVSRERPPSIAEGANANELHDPDADTEGPFLEPYPASSSGQRSDPEQDEQRPPQSMSPKGDAVNPSPSEPEEMDK
ncbi:hypothetical protein F4808DRAFT_463363 [Astrocystis sublimbata]|nr:hypothetical protein F4808DRAFT_463363 [Astrocystis sublimbata]